MTTRHPHATAWVIVLSGFIAFCLLCSTSGLGTYWFLFDSAVPLTIRLTVSRGNVKLQTLNGDNPLVENTHSIDLQTTLDVKEASQGILSFQDSYSGEIVSTITLTELSHVTVNEASRPRFNWSRKGYSIILNNADGQLQINASPRERAFSMEVRAEAGIARLYDDGIYTISTDQDVQNKAHRLHVFNQGGQAWLYVPSSNVQQQVYPNTIGTSFADRGTIEMSESPYKILAAGLFKTAEAAAPETLPPGWVCNTAVSDRNEPFGVATRNPSEGHALQLMRVGPNRLGHGETSCLTYLNAENADASNYDSLRITMRIKLVATNELAVQDVPVCGVQASECPVMVELDYQTPGAPEYRKWNHGFYADADPSYPQTCATCRVAHERINPNVWYFYDSGPLSAQLGDSPPLIKQLSVYASGHQYNALIAEVTLLGIPKRPA